MRVLAGVGLRGQQRLDARLRRLAGFVVTELDADALHLVALGARRRHPDDLAGHRQSRRVL